jgi:transcriptional regulator with XRE-family HTH domain
MPVATFRDRLNRLFDEVHPPGRGPYSVAEVGRGTGLSLSYLRYLRDGSRDNPTIRQVAALARFFRVPPGFFFADDPISTTADDLLALLASFARTPVREFAAQVPALSDAALGLLNQFAAMLALAQGPQGLSGGHRVGARAPG